MSFMHLCNLPIGRREASHMSARGQLISVQKHAPTSLWPCRFIGCCCPAYATEGIVTCRPLPVKPHEFQWCRGLLIRGGDILEAASKVDSVVFDKTGTLTVGRPAVTDIRLLPSSGIDSAELLSIAAALERESTHPIASAVNEAASSQGAPAKLQSQSLAAD